MNKYLLPMLMVGIFVACSVVDNNSARSKPDTTSPESSDPLIPLEPSRPTFGGNGLPGNHLNALEIAPILKSMIVPVVDPSYPISSYFLYYKSKIDDRKIVHEFNKGGSGLTLGSTGVSADNAVFRLFLTPKDGMTASDMGNALNIETVEAGDIDFAEYADLSRLMKVTLNSGIMYFYVHSYGNGSDINATSGFWLQSFDPQTGFNMDYSLVSLNFTEEMTNLLSKDEYLEFSLFDTNGLMIRLMLVKKR